MTDPRRIGEIERIRRAQQELVDHLTVLAEAGVDPAAPSSLPGWTLGHVVTHLARNAEALTGILRGVDRGESVEQYPGGQAAREAAIAAGASRPWPELVDDARATAEALVEQMRSQRRWDGAGISVSGAPFPADDLPFRRWREVLVHHADLGDAGYTPSNWPVEYVDEELRRLEMEWSSRAPIGRHGLPAAAAGQPPLVRVLWLLGRIDIPGVEPAGIY